MKALRPSVLRPLAAVGLASLMAAIAISVIRLPDVTAVRPSEKPAANAPGDRAARPAQDHPGAEFQPRMPLDTGGYSLVVPALKPWGPDASLEEVAESWRRVGYRFIEQIDRQAASVDKAGDRTRPMLLKAMLLNYEGEPDKAYEVLRDLRAEVERDRARSSQILYTIIFFQGVTAIRRGENDNCIMCRGESSCILPISKAAVHADPEGSRLAIGHFTEYLAAFPEDLEVRWLLNLARMTLGEHPDKVDPRHLISLDRFRKSEFDIGRFRDVGHLAKVNRFNQAGGAIMEDFDGDGRLDIVLSSFDPTLPMSYFHSKGDGTFEDRAESAGLSGQLGGLNCVQGDYNNDGHMDIFVARGAWLQLPIRPSLLRNNGDGTFADVTKEAGLLDPVNSNSASWADYDNDGSLDLFICCENQPNRLYHNKGDGTFEEVAGQSGVLSGGPGFCKGAAWVDIDNDDYPDLFFNNLDRRAQLYHNERDGLFTEVTSTRGIDGPSQGFSCWAWDYDNDGWLDIFASCYDRTLGDVVKGLIGQPHSRGSNRLFRNMEGRGFEDRTREAGLDMVFATMGSNFGDFDNDGFLDMYLATGEPNLSTLIPNRMFKNVGGKRFSEITGTSGTGHLQKGHGVACGDYDRDGDTDIFVEMGGAINGDRYHDILFQNPGQGNHWLTIKLVGKKTNRAAIGARIKAVAAGPEPAVVCRHVSSGSSFGGNTLEQTVGLGQADRVATLEIHWPTSGTTQIFRDIAPDQAIEVTEFSEGYRALDWKPIAAPK